MLVNRVKNHLAGQLPECIILAIICLLVAVNVSTLLDVDIWRQDSMYYVSSYSDKLAQEGRWINYLLFRFLQLVPSDLAILLSACSVIYFSYRVAYKVVVNHYFALSFGALCALIPVLWVQLEWPETILFGFLFLAFSPHIQTKLPVHYFFLLMAVIFFGTYSPFYFLMPLLFLNELNRKQFGMLLGYWIGSFLLAYLITNLIVLAATGDTIQIASWRHPNYVTDISSLYHNLQQAWQTVNIHTDKIGSFIKPTAIALLASISLFIAIRQKRVFAFLITTFSVFAIYVSAVPIGIYVQERTTLATLIALMAVFFLSNFTSRKTLLAMMSLMCILAIRMASVGNEGINWFKAHNDVLVRQFTMALDYSPEEIGRVYIAASLEESATLFAKIETNLDRENTFSEGFYEPSYWVPALRSLGFRQFRPCPDMQGRDCELVVEHYLKRNELPASKGLFVSQKLPDGSLLLMINPHYSL